MSARVDVRDQGSGAAPVAWVRVARDFGELLGRAFVLAVAVGLLLTLAAVALPAPVREASGELSPEQMPSGSFLMRRTKGEPWAQAPTLATEVGFRVAGVVEGHAAPGDVLPVRRAPAGRPPALRGRRAVRGGAREGERRLTPVGRAGGAPPPRSGRSAAGAGSSRTPDALPLLGRGPAGRRPGWRGRSPGSDRGSTSSRTRKRP